MWLIYNIKTFILISLWFFHVDDEQTEYAMSEILRFITGLRVRMILSDEESKSLEELLFENGYIKNCIYANVIQNSHPLIFSRRFS
jgi:hypothetical protein